eukprot:COSAG01_NODE_9106_length_2552_cov_1.619242_5_plen_85_part_00
MNEVFRFVRESWDGGDHCALAALVRRRPEEVSQPVGAVRGQPVAVAGRACTPPPRCALALAECRLHADVTCPHVRLPCRATSGP